MAAKKTSAKPKIKATTMRLPTDVIALADKRAKALDTSRTQVVIGLIRDNLKPRPPSGSVRPATPDIFD